MNENILSAKFFWVLIPKLTYKNLDSFLRSFKQMKKEWIY